jgi:hypothetical protein
VGKVVASATWSVMFVFFVLYSLSVISFCFMVSTWFSRARVAGGVNCLWIVYESFILWANSPIRNIARAKKWAALCDTFCIEKMEMPHTFSLQYLYIFIW